MAIITPSALVSNIRGKINGSVFQGSTQGILMRNKPTKLGQGSQSQQNVRHINAQLNFAWTSFTNAERAVWQAFADYVNGIGITKRGKRSSNTGKLHFMAINFYCKLYGKPIITAPTFTTPPSIAIPCPPLFTQSPTLMNSTYSLDTTQEILITKISLPQSNPTRTTNTGFRTLVYTQVDGDTQDWATAYQNQYGISLIMEKYYWVSLQVVNFINGTISPEARQLIWLHQGTGIGSMAIGSTFIVG